MNFSKVIRGTTGIMAVMGFFLMVGTAGRSDYMDAIGAYYPVTKMLPQMLIGLAMMIPAFFAFRDYELEDEEDWEDWEDEIYED